MPTLDAINETIEAPVQATQYPYGLFSVVPTTTPASARWEIGVTWNTDICGPVRVSEGLACAADQTTDDFALDRWCAVGVFKPATVYVYGEQSTGANGNARAIHAASTRTRFDAGRQAGMEVILRRRLQTAVPSPTTVSITGYTEQRKVVAGLAYVENALRNTGIQGVITIDPWAATLLGDTYLRPNGQRLQTNLGTPVIVAATLATAVPTTTVIYGTGPMFLFTDEVTSDSIFDRSINDVRTMVQQRFLVGWDCTAVAASVTL